MIQTTKDADKAKTSQRQRVDDQNDRFVSRNCHHAPHQSHVFWALFIRGVILYLTLMTKSIQPYLMAHDLGLGTQVRKVLLPVLVPSAGLPGGGEHGHLSTSQASVEVCR